MVTQDDTTELLEQIGDLAPETAAARLRSQAAPVIRGVLEALPPEVAFAVAAHLPGDPPSTAEDDGYLAVDIDGTVAELMQLPVGVLPAATTIAGAIDHLVHTQPVTDITYIYVVDQQRKLVGVVAMRDLLLSRPGQTLSEVMTPQPFAFGEDSSIGAAVREALKRHYRIYPVVDKQGHVVGIVQGWQLFERVASEISAQTGSMVGVDREERVHTPIRESFRMRHPWLQVNLLTAFAAAFVVSMFEDTISRVVVLAAFLPVLAGQSGNTGCQALAITLRGLTLGELGDYPVRYLLRKEIILGALNGLLVGIVAAVAMWAYAGTAGAASPATLALVVLLAMVGACVGSGVFGVMVPITLRRFGADPAMASSIFLTTFTDILGMGLMLALAAMLV